MRGHKTRDTGLTSQYSMVSGSSGIVVKAKLVHNLIGIVAHFYGIYYTSNDSIITEIKIGEHLFQRHKEPFINIMLRHFSSRVDIVDLALGYAYSYVAGFFFRQNLSHKSPCFLQSQSVLKGIHLAFIHHRKRTRVTSMEIKQTL